MKKPGMNIRTLYCLAILVIVLLLPTSAFAVIVTNTANGDVAGDATALNSGTFDIDIITLSVSKTAFLTSDGTAITSGAQIAKGTLVDFMLYIDNTTDADMIDVALTDALPAGFVYQPGTIEVGTAATGSTPAVLYAAIKGSGALTDAEAAGDVAGINGTTITVGNNVGQPNDQLDIVVSPAGSEMWGIVFTVQLQ